MSLSDTISDPANIITDQNLGIIQPSTQINSNIDNLNSAYIENQGLKIKIFNYKNSAFNYYIDHYTKFFDIFMQIFNLPEIIRRYSIAKTNTYTLEKSLFNNLTVSIEFIDTFASLENNFIDKIFSNSIVKDFQGGYPSLLFNLFTPQIENILRNDLVTNYYKNKIPFFVKYGTITPYILYKKYLKDLTNIKSYILNIGPCYLDELSCYFNFLRCKAIAYNEPSNFTRHDLFNTGLSDFGIEIPNQVFFTEDNNLKLLFNNFYSRSYNYDISNQVLFYIGIDNSYGNYDSIEYLKAISNKLYIYKFDGYDVSLNSDIQYTRKNIGTSITQQEYDEFIQNMYNNPDLFLDNSTSSLLSVKTNPRVIAIIFPEYNTQEEYLDKKIGIAVNQAWDLLDYIVTDYSNNQIVTSIGDIDIFVRSYGKESDLETLKFLYNNSKYVSRTCGSYYDFQETNFKNALFQDNNRFNDLMTIRSHNIANSNFMNLIIEKYNTLKEYITSSIPDNYIENIDQIKLNEMLINLNIIPLLIINLQINKGILIDYESLKINYKVFTGEELFTTNDASFDFYQIGKVNGAPGMIAYGGGNVKLFTGLYSISFIDNKQVDSSTGFPFNRNPSYNLFRRNYNLINQFNYKYYPYFTHRLQGSHFSLAIPSEINLVNSIIFKLNNDTTNAELFFNRYRDDFNKHSIITMIDGTNIDIIHSNSSFDINYSIDNGIEINQIETITVGNMITKLDSNLFQNSSVKRVYINKNVETIQNNCFRNCTNLISVEFIDISNSKLSILGDSVFMNCNNLNTILLPDSTRFIYSNCFNNCSSLPYVNIPTSLTTINSRTFHNCLSLNNIKLSSNINKIEEYAFSNCQSLSNFQFNSSNTLTSIEQYAFYQSDISNIYIYSNVNKIGNYAFSSCQNLKTVEFQKNSKLTEILSNTFENCTNLEFINSASLNISSIYEYAFYNCSNLKNIVLPYTLNSIEQYSFALCNKLENIAIEGSLNYISNTAFDDISNGLNIYYYSNLYDAIYNFNTQFINFNNVIDISFKDLFYVPLDPVTVFAYSQYLIIERNDDYSEPQPPFSVFFNFFGDLLDDISYNIEEIYNDLSLGQIGDYRIDYLLTYGNNFTKVLTRNFTIVESPNPLKPEITLKGITSQNIIIPNNYTESGYSATVTIPNQQTISLDFSQTLGDATKTGNIFFLPQVLNSFSGYQVFNLDVFPFYFKNNGKISFNYNSPNGNVSLFFVFESVPANSSYYYFITENFTCISGTSGVAEINIPKVENDISFNQVLLILTTRNVEIELYNFTVLASKTYDSSITQNVEVIKLDTFNKTIKSNYTIRYIAIYNNNYAIKKRTINNYYNFEPKFRNLKINREKTSYIESQSTLYIQFENNGLLPENGILYDNDFQNNYYFDNIENNTYFNIIPLLFVTNNPDDAFDLSNVNGPNLDMSFVVNNTRYYFNGNTFIQSTYSVGQTPEYYPIIFYSDITILDKSDFSFNIYRNQFNGYMYYKDLFPINSYVQLKIKFNNHTPGLKLAILFDSGVLKVNNEYLLNGANVEQIDTYTNPTDNVYVVDFNTFNFYIN